MYSRVCRRVERQAVRLDHARARGWSVIAAEPGRAVAGEGRDDARAAVDPANTMIMPVGDIDVCGIVDRDAVGLVETGTSGRTAIPGIAGLAAAGAGRDHTGARVDAPNAMVERVGKIEIAVRVEPDVERAVQQGPRRRPAIAGIAFLAGSHRCRNDPGLLWHRLDTPALRMSILALQKGRSSRRKTAFLRCSFRAADRRGRIAHVCSPHLASPQLWPRSRRWWRR